MTKAHRHPYPTPTLTGRAAITEAPLGKDRVDIGVLAGTPRIIFEDATFTIWEIDNSAGTLRFYTPGSLKASLSTAGDFTAVGVLIGAAVHAKGAAAGLVFQNRSGAELWQWYTSANVARLHNGTSDVVTVTSDGVVKGKRIYRKIGYAGVGNVPTGALTTIPLGVDLGGFDATHDGVDEIVINTAGRYDLSGQNGIVLGPAVSATNVVLNITKNVGLASEEYLAISSTSAGVGEDIGQNIQCKANLVVGDRISLGAAQNSGAGADYYSARMFLSADYLGPA